MHPTYLPIAPYPFSPCSLQIYPCSYPFTHAPYPFTHAPYQITHAPYPFNPCSLPIYQCSLPIYQCSYSFTFAPFPFTHAPYPLPLCSLSFATSPYLITPLLPNLYSLSLPHYPTPNLFSPNPCNNKELSTPTLNYKPKTAEFQISKIVKLDTRLTRYLVMSILQSQSFLN